MLFFCLFVLLSPVKVEVIHNASVMGAVASCGLQLYNFGQTVSIPLWNENWEPDSFHDKIKVNKAVRCLFQRSKISVVCLAQAFRCSTRYHVMQSKHVRQVRW